MHPTADLIMEIVLWSIGGIFMMAFLRVLIWLVRSAWHLAVELLSYPVLLLMLVASGFMWVYHGIWLLRQKIATSRMERHGAAIESLKAQRRELQAEVERLRDATEKDDDELPPDEVGESCWHGDNVLALTSQESARTQAIVARRQA